MALYRSNHGRTMADLLMRRGDAAGQHAREKGRIWSSAIQGVANAPMQTLQGLHQIRDMQDRRAYMQGLTENQQLQRQAAEREQQLHATVREALSQTDGDPADAQELLSSQGNYEGAAILRQQVHAQQIQSAERAEAEAREMFSKIGMAATHLRGAVNNETYEPVRDRARTLLEKYPEIANRLPETFNRPQLEQFYDLTRTEAQRLEHRRLTAAAARAAIDQNLPEPDRLRAGIDFLAERLSLAKNETDWQDAIAWARAAGFSPQAIDYFGRQFNDQARALAQQHADTQLQGAKGVGTRAEWLRRETEGGRPMTPQLSEQADALFGNEEGGAGKSTALTPAQVNAIDRDFTSKARSLQRDVYEFRITPEQYDNGLLETINSWRRQMGYEQYQALPPLMPNHTLMMAPDGTERSVPNDSVPDAMQEGARMLPWSNLIRRPGEGQ